MPIAFEIQQGLPCVFTNLPNLVATHHACIGSSHFDVMMSLLLHTCTQWQFLIILCFTSKK